jgi:hypothetical protein
MKINGDEAAIVVDALEDYLAVWIAIGAPQRNIEAIENTLKRFRRSLKTLDRIEGFK